MINLLYDKATIAKQNRNKKLKKMPQRKRGQRKTVTLPEN